MFVIDFSTHLTKKDYPVRNVRISPDSGTLAATFGAEGKATEVAWWSRTEDKLIATRLIAQNGEEIWAEPVFDLTLSKCLIHHRSASVDEIVVLTQTDSNQVGARFSITTDDRLEDVRLCAFAVSRNSEWLLSGHDGGDLALSGLRFQPLNPTLTRKQQPWVRDPDERNGVRLATSLEFTPDSKYIAAGCGDGEVRLLTFASGRLRGTLNFPELERINKSVRGLRFTENSSLLAVQSGGRIAVFSLEQKSTAAQLQPTELTDMAFTPDGRRMLTGGMDKLVRVWDTTTWKEIAQYDWKIGPIHSVTVSPDGLTAAAGGDKSRVVVWDVES